MTVRTKDQWGNNLSFELIAQRIGGLEKNLKFVQSTLETAGMMGGPSGGINKPQPAIPHKIAEEADASGIDATVDILIPNNGLSTVRAEYIRVFDNTLQAGETMQQGLDRALKRIKIFDFEVNDTDAMAGHLIRQVGPLRPKKDPEKNKYQLLRLIGRDERGNRVKNPTMTPFNAFPFSALIIDVNDGKFFTIGDSGIGQGPSVPSTGLIVENKVNLETRVSDADITFRVEFSQRKDGMGNLIDSAADLDIDSVTVVLEDVAATQFTGGETKTRIRVHGTVTERDSKFILLTKTLPLGKQYKWVKTVTRNASGEPRISIPASDVTFYAGGDPPTAGIPEIETFSITQILQKDNNQTQLTVSIKQFANSPQRPFATLLKRLVFFVREPGDTENIDEKTIDLLGEGNEAVFVQGATTTFKRKVKHRANLKNIMFGATIFGINHKPSVPIKRDATGLGDSTLATAPSAPAANLLVTAPDDETDEGNDAYADFTVFANAADNTKKFSDSGIDHIAIKLRKSSGGADDDPDDNRIPKYIFPIEDPDQVSAVFRVRGLKRARQYIWVLNIAIRSGINSRSAKTNVPFRAGLMQQDPSGVGIVVGFVQENKRNARLTCTITQPTPAVYLKEAEIYVDVNDGQGFQEVRSPNLRKKPQFQMAGQAATFRRRIHTPPFRTNVRAFVRVIAVGGLFKDSSTVTINTVGGEAPAMAPSIPQAGDIQFNGITQDVTMGHAKTTFRVYAAWDRVTTFDAIGADAVKVVLTDVGDSASPEKQRYSIDATIIDGTQAFIDVEATVLTAGKLYLWRRNINLRNGVPNKSSLADVVFVAGGAVGTTGSFGLPELANVSVVLSPVMTDNNKQDTRSAEFTLTFAQAQQQTAGVGNLASTTAGSAIVNVSSAANVRVGYKISVLGVSRTIVSISGNQLTVDQTYSFTTTSGWNFTPPVVLLKRYVPFIVRPAGSTNPANQRKRKGDRILDEQELQTVGTKTIVDDVNVPRKTNFSLMVRLIAVGGNSRDVYSTTSMTTLDDKPFEDAGSPLPDGFIQIRWRTTHLRVKFNLSNIVPGASIGDNQNLNTHVSNKLLFYFILSNNQRYIWDPINVQTLNIGMNNPVGAFSPLTNPSVRAYLQDIGKGSIGSFNNRIPASQSDGMKYIDVDDTIVYDSIQMNGGTLLCDIYLFNQFGDVLTGTVVLGNGFPLFIGMGWVIEGVSP